MRSIKTTEVLFQELVKNLKKKISALLSRALQLHLLLVIYGKDYSEVKRTQAYVNQMIDLISGLKLEESTKSLAETHQQIPIVLPCGMEDYYPDPNELVLLEPLISSRRNHLKMHQGELLEKFVDLQVELEESLEGSEELSQKLINKLEAYLLALSNQPFSDQGLDPKIRHDILILTRSHLQEFQVELKKIVEQLDSEFTKSGGIAEEIVKTPRVKPHPILNKLILFFNITDILALYLKPLYSILEQPGFLRQLVEIHSLDSRLRELKTKSRFAIHLIQNSLKTCYDELKISAQELIESNWHLSCDHIKEMVNDRDDFATFFFDLRRQILELATLELFLRKNNSSEEGIQLLTVYRTKLILIANLIELYAETSPQWLDFSRNFLDAKLDLNAHVEIVSKKLPQLDKLFEKILENYNELEIIEQQSKDFDQNDPFSPQVFKELYYTGGNLYTKTLDLIVKISLFMDQNFYKKLDSLSKIDELVILFLLKKKIGVKSVSEVCVDTIEFCNNCITDVRLLIKWLSAPDDDETVNDWLKELVRQWDYKISFLQTFQNQYALLGRLPVIMASDITINLAKLIQELQYVLGDAEEFIENFNQLDGMSSSLILCKIQEARSQLEDNFLVLENIFEILKDNKTLTLEQIEYFRNTYLPKLKSTYEGLCNKLDNLEKLFPKSRRGNTIYDERVQENYKNYVYVSDEEECSEKAPSEEDPSEEDPSEEESPQRRSTN